MCTYSYTLPHHHLLLLASLGTRLDEPPLSFYAGTNAEACHMIESVKQIKAKIIESNPFNMDGHQDSLYNGL